MTTSQRWYYYEPKKNHFINWATKGIFSCEKDSEKSDRHSRQTTIGDSYTFEVSYKESELENGDLLSTRVMCKAKVARDRKDLKCRCGAKMVFKGYMVHEQRIIKEGKKTGIFIQGEVTKDKFRWFKKKNKQLEYVKALNIKIKDAQKSIK